MYSNNIRKSFGLDRCERINSKRSNIITTERIALSEGHIADDQDSCKYLGIPQANGNNEQAAKKSATA